MTNSLTVYFDEPFWVGVFERVEDGKLSACRMTFGAEPKDYEVWEFVLRHYDALSFSPALAIDVRQAANSRRGRRWRIVLDIAAQIWYNPIDLTQ